jgi:hypothetical protein
MDDVNAGVVMTHTRFRVDAEFKGSHFTDLFASISEEDDGYTVQIRLYDRTKPDSAAWGEEVADSVETASMLVGALAAEFSIPEARIQIEIRMNNLTSGTRH